MLLLASELFNHVGASHADYAEDDERNAEQLAHVEHHRCFKRFLYVLGELDEEAGGEDERYAQSEEEARAHAFGVFAVQVPAYEEEHGVGYCLIELSGVARHHVDALEDERPWHVGGLAYNLRVHKVAKTYEAGRSRRGYGYVVEYSPDVYLSAAYVEPEGYYQSDGAAVACQSLIAGELPRAVGHEVYWQYHLHHVPAARQEIVRLIEQTVAQARAYQYADEAVDEERIEQLRLYLLLGIQPFYYEICRQQTEQPAQRVPAERETADVECHKVWIPHNV